MALPVDEDGDEDDENDGDVIQACRSALQDYQQSAKTLNDKEDFCDWIEQGARKSF